MQSEPSRPPDSFSPVEEQSVERNELRILLAILIAAALVRLPGLFTSLWHDEVMYSRLFFDDPARRSWLLWKDVHPPVYALLLWLWSSVFGNGEATLRLPSFLTGLGSLAVSWALARRCFGVRVALLATAFLAFSPPHIWHSTESKANMLALFLSVLAVWLGVRAVEPPGVRWRWLAMMAVLGLALGTHSHVLATAGTLFAWLGWRSWKERRLRLPAAAAGVMILAVWLPLFLWKTRAQGASLARSYLRSFNLGEVYKLLFVWFPHGNTIRSVSPYRSWGELLQKPWFYFFVDAFCAAAFLLGLWAAVRGARGAGSPGPGERGPWSSRLLLLWLLPPLLAAALASLAIRHFYIERNFLLLLPAYSILLSFGVARLRWAWVRAIASAGLLVLAFAGTFTLLVYGQERWTVHKPKPDWRSAAAWLETEGVREGKLAVVMTTPPIEAEFYLRPKERTRPAITVTEWCRTRVSPLFLARQGGGSFWLVKTELWDGCWLLARRQALGDSGVMLRGERHFAGLTLYEFAAK